MHGTLQPSELIEASGLGNSERGIACGLHCVLTSVDECQNRSFGSLILDLTAAVVTTDFYSREASPSLYDPKNEFRAYRKRVLY